MDPQNASICSRAIGYGAYGWHVLPIWGIRGGKCQCGRPDCRQAGKHPHSEYAPHGSHSATADASTIYGWFANGQILNLGVATGAPSGIVVLDIDPRNGGDRMALGDLPDTAEVATGGGGTHLYYRLPEGAHIGCPKGRLGPGIDVKGDGGYVVAPPSRHISGGEYRWVHHPADGIADLPNTILQRLTERSLQRTEETEKQRIALCKPGPTLCKVPEDLSVKSGEDDVGRAIVETLPTTEGQRNRAIFGLAQALKGIAALKDRPASDLRGIVERWHTLALPVIATKSFDATWADFCYCWPRVKWATGSANPLLIALGWAQADDGTPPEAASYHDARTRLLVRVCYHLQKMHGGEPFFLSWHAAGRLIQMSHPEAGRRLEMLMADGLLAIAQPNTTRKATRYKYVGGEQARG